jgi:hypothetical protein
MIILAVSSSGTCLSAQFPLELALESFAALQRAVPSKQRAAPALRFMPKYGAIALLVIAPLSSSAFLPELSLRNGCPTSRRRPADRASVAALDADTLRDCAIYDAAMDAELRDLKARVQSAEFNAEQQRGLVEMAQKT